MRPYVTVSRKFARLLEVRELFTAKMFPDIAAASSSSFAVLRIAAQTMHSYIHMAINYFEAGFI